MPCFPVHFPTLLPSVQHLILHAHSQCVEETHVQKGTCISFVMASIWLPVLVRTHCAAPSMPVLVIPCPITTQSLASHGFFSFQSGEILYPR